MKRFPVFFLRAFCDPRRLEEMEGDLEELYARRRTMWGRRRAAARYLEDLLSVSVHRSRIRRWPARRRALLAGHLALVFLALTVIDSHPAQAARSYRVSASDPAGSFSLEIRDTRVIAATVDGLRVSPDRLDQIGLTLTIRGTGRHSDFSLEIDPYGGIRWTPRRRA